MAELAIEPQSVIEKLGFKTLKDDEIRQIIYMGICSRLEDELMVKRNKIFGWSDSVDVDIKGESWVDTYWAVVVNGKIIQIKLEYDGITLAGNSRACQKMGKQFLKFIGKLSQKSILRKIEQDLTADQQTALKKWQSRNKIRAKNKTRS